MVIVRIVYVGLTNQVEISSVGVGWRSFDLTQTDRPLQSSSSVPVQEIDSSVVLITETTTRVRIACVNCSFLISKSLIVFLLLVECLVYMCIYSTTALGTASYRKFHKQCDGCYLFTLFMLFACITLCSLFYFQFRMLSLQPL